MEQQNQQPIREETENKSPIKTNPSTLQDALGQARSVRSWKPLAIVVFLAVLVGGAIWLWYEYQQRSFRKPLLVVAEDQTCKLDTDCVIVETNCSSCECGVPINKVHQQKYQSEYEILCKNYRGPIAECVFDCSTLFSRCINNRCALSAEKSKDDVSNWQTYRNEEYGFEFRYPAELMLIEHGIYAEGSDQNVFTVINPEETLAFVVAPLGSSEVNFSSTLQKITREDGVFQGRQAIIEQWRTEEGFEYKRVINILNPTDSWTTQNFIAVDIDIQNPQWKCGVELPPGKICEVRHGTRVSGKVSGEHSLLKDQILSTFRFVK